MVPMVDVQSLREGAAARAARRPRQPFDGSVQDAVVGGVRVRRYSPSGCAGAGAVYFAHGGYGLFGTLDLQDGYCRILAEGLGCTVVAIDYRLTPEATFGEATDDLIAVVRADGGDSPAYLAGDSAGGALAVAAAAALPETAALLLTNPNLDLSLATFDATAPDGPDLPLSRYAFTQWARPRPLVQAPRLHEPETRLPAAFVAVGALDALLPEGRALVGRLRQRGVRASLHELADMGHGFIADPDTARSVAGAMKDFLDAGSAEP